MLEAKDDKIQPENIPTYPLEHTKTTPQPTAYVSEILVIDKTSCIGVATNSQLMRGSLDQSVCFQVFRICSLSGNFELIIFSHPKQNVVLQLCVSPKTMATVSKEIGSSNYGLNTWLSTRPQKRSTHELHPVDPKRPSMQVHGRSEH